MDDGMNGFASLAAAAGSNGSGALNGVGANEIMGLAMRFLPRLLENAEERDVIATQQKESFTVLRKQVHALRQDLRDLMQSHTEALEELREMRQLQASVVAHLARVQIMESPRDDPDLGDEGPDEFAHARQRRRNSLQRR